MNEIIHSGFWVILAKVIMVIIMFAFGTIGLIVVRNSRAWEQALLEAESECDFTRDMTMVQATAARSQLAEIRERLKKKPDKAEMEVISTLMKQAMPVISLLLKKETSLIKWGFAGAKLAKSAYEFFRAKK